MTLTRESALQKAIIDLLAEGGHTNHLLWIKLQSSFPRLRRSSMYRSLSGLIEKGVIERQPKRGYAKLMRSGRREWVTWTNRVTEENFLKVDVHPARSDVDYPDDATSDDYARWKKGHTPIEAQWEYGRLQQSANVGVRREDTYNKRLER